MTAPAKRTTQKAAQKPAKPTETFDFSTVTVQDGTAPQRTGGRSNGPNPFVAHLQASMDAKKARPGGGWIGQGKTLTVPVAQAKAAVNLIRYAANRLNIGSVISDLDDPKQKRPNGMVQIDFAAKNRKLKRATPATPAATTPAAPTAQ